MGLEVADIGGLILLALCLYALINVFGSSASTGSKVVWSLLILLLPFLGFLIWLVAGPRSAKAPA